MGINVAWGHGDAWSGGTWDVGGVPNLQVMDVEVLLIDVGGIGTGRQPCHGGQVAAEAAHSLDDEDATLGPSRRLLDAVTGLWRWKNWGGKKGFTLTSVAAVKWGEGAGGRGAALW